MVDAASSRTFGSRSATDASTADSKFRHLIEPGFFQQLRTDMTELFAYVGLVGPIMEGLQTFLGWLRVLQLLGAALSAANMTFWTKPADMIVAVASVCFHIVPPAYRAAVAAYWTMGELAVEVALLALLFCAARMLRTKAQLPSWIPIVVLVAMPVVGYVLLAIVMNSYGEDIGRWVSGEPVAKLSVAMMVVELFVSAITVYAFVDIYSVSLTFRPTSLATVCALPDRLIFIVTLAVNFLQGFGSRAPRIWGIATGYVSGVLMLIAAISAFRSGGFIRLMEGALVLGTCLSAAVMHMVIATSLLVHADGTVAHFVAFGVMVLIACGGSYFLLDNWRTGHLVILDGFQEEPTDFALVGSANHFVNVAVTGFAAAHSSVLDWTFMRWGAQQWPRSMDVWFSFARFLAVYPDEGSTLAWVRSSVHSQRLSGSERRALMLQSRSVLSSRESYLSPRLKERMDVLGKKVEQSRQKLKHVWDVVIQGRVADVGPSVDRAWDAIESNSLDFLRLLRLWPNNRFLTRAYAKYLRDLRADYQGWAEQVERTRLLLRGVHVQPDQPHELGLLAFPMLPDYLPHRIRQTQTGTITDRWANEQPGDSPRGEGEADQEHATALRETIAGLHIPGPTRVRVLRLVAFLVLSVAPAIVMLLFRGSWVGGLYKFAPQQEALSRARMGLLQLALISHRRILGRVQEGVTLSEYRLWMETVPFDGGPESLGGTWDLGIQLSKAFNISVQALQGVDSVREANTERPVLQAELDRLLFSPSMVYRSYGTDPMDWRDVTLLAGFADWLVYLDTLTRQSFASMTRAEVMALLNTPVTQNVLANYRTMTAAISTAATQLKEDVRKVYKETAALVLYVAVGISGVMAVGYVLLAIYGVKAMRSNTLEVYSCVTALPKSTVALIGDSLHSVQREGSGDGEARTATSDVVRHKGEENVLQMFHNGSTGGGGGGTWLVVLGTFLVIGLNAALAFQMVSNVQVDAAIVRDGSPHLDNAGGAIGLNMGAFFTLQHLMLCWRENDEDMLFAYGPGLCTRDIFAPEDMIAQIQEQLKEARDLWSGLRYGAAEGYELPLAGVQEILDASPKCTRDDVLATYDDVVRCMHWDLLILHYEAEIRRHIVTARAGLPGVFRYGTRPAYAAMFQALLSPLMERVFLPMFGLANERMVDGIRARDALGTGLSVMLLLLVVVLEMAFQGYAASVGAHIRTVLSLLMHVPRDVLQGTPAIMKVLAGNFASTLSASGRLGAEFFDRVFQMLPLPVVYAQAQTLQIQGTNEAFRKLFSLEEDPVGLPLAEVFGGGSLIGDISQVFSGHSTVQVTLVGGESEIELEVTGNLHVGGNRLIVTFLDVTQTSRLMALIQEERDRSDELLRQILPPSLVPRVAAGEQDISFAVQSASISFTDIVSFTPWCSKTEAARVMQILNTLFNSYDREISARATLMRTKCIGDCYVAMGGIFAEENQPTVHAREMVSFCVAAVESLRRVSESFGESLQCRSGVNTGGPLVAGVLGGAKPTFEVLGPAINMAQQMEHHGVPGSVHIPRAVYELIYGGDFIVKERGPVEVKSGTITTYLVTGLRGHLAESSTSSRMARGSSVMINSMVVGP